MEAPFFLEVDLGRGRGLSLSRHRLEWRRRRGAPPVQIDLARLARVRLHRRPVFESLAFAALALLALPLVSSLPGRAALVALLLWALAACFAQRRYVLHLQDDRGREATLPLGLGRPRTPRGRQLESAWESLSGELRSLGVNIKDC